jgi:hypothetical protein
MLDEWRSIEDGEGFAGESGRLKSRGNYDEVAHPDHGA